jgi:hypothetical protein
MLCTNMATKYIHKAITWRKFCYNTYVQSLNNHLFAIWKKEFYFFFFYFAEKKQERYI